MPRKSSDYRAAVWTLLADGQWHSGLALVRVGGMRAGARVHELRRGEGGGPTRRILCRVKDGCSEYRWVCDCGPLPLIPGPETPFCPRCRAVLTELVDQAAARGNRADLFLAPSEPQQLGLFKRGA